MSSKLSQAFEDAFYRKCETEISKQALADSRKIKNTLRKRASIKKRDVKRIKRSVKAPDTMFTRLEALSALTAPVLNLTAQDKNVLRSNNANVKKAKNVVGRLAGQTIRNPEQYVENAYNSITERGDKSKDSKHKSFVEYLDGIDDRRQQLMKRTFRSLEKSYKGILGMNVDRFFSTYTKGVDIGLGHLDAVNEAFGDFHPEQAVKNRLITEVHTQLEDHKLANAGDMNMNHKYWRTQRDVRVRDSHLVLDGELVPRGKNFNVGGHKALYPGDTRLPPEEYFNCRCSVEYQFVPRGTRQGTKTPRVTGAAPALAEVLQAPVFEPADTVAQALRNVKDETPHVEIEDSFARLSQQDFVKGALNNFVEIHKQHEVLKKYPIQLSRETRSKSTYAQYQYYALGMDERYSLNSIDFEISKFKKANKLQDLADTYNKDVATNFHPKVDEGKEHLAVYEHEFGHHVQMTVFTLEHFVKKQSLPRSSFKPAERYQEYQDMLSDFKNSALGHVSYSTLSQKSTQLRKSSSIYYANAVRERYDEMFGEGRERDEVNLEFGRQISKYGMQDSYEFFAETWTEWRLNKKNPSKLAQAFGSVVEEVFNEIENNS